MKPPTATLNLDAALALARIGFAVFPCRADKTPLLKDWPNRASTDEKVIRGWWRQFPTAVPAIACGASGLLVVDCDRKNGKDGVAEWLRLCATNELDPVACPIIETPSGGQHYYFRQLPGSPLGNTASRIGGGIDTRGAGGYVIAPGAMLTDGRCYRLLSGALDDIPPLHEGLRDYLASVAAGPKLDRTKAPPPPAPEFTAAERERAYALKALAEEADAIAAAAEGTRNRTLNNAAFKIGTLLPMGGITAVEAEATLTDAALRAGLEHAEIHATIRSGFDAGMTNPRPSLAEQDAQLRQGVEIVGVGPTMPPNAPPMTWTDPKPLPSELLPVAHFEPAFLPVEVADWVMDIADRMQCPPDFVAVSVMVALAATIGRQVAIRPKRADGWTEYANLWGLVIGRPGVMKSPAMGEALKPLKALEKKAFESYVTELDAFRAAFDDFELRTAAAKKAKSEQLKANPDAELVGSTLKAPIEPKPKRFIVTDSTYEALGEIIGSNPNGVLVHRDEIMSLLKMLDRDENIAARGFFLSGWTGSEGYTFDRIGRSGARIDAVCLSLLGSTQPGRATAYIAPALRGGAADDGMVQRFSLTVWPDVSPDWKYVERSLNIDARNRAFRVFERLADLSHTNFGATFDAIDDCVYLTFDDPASAIFADWLTGLEQLIRSGDLHPALESHFAKYRKLVPTLALINHLADGATGPVGPVALNRAIAFSRYLESHARRLYGAGLRQEVVTAQAILSRIRKGELPDGFTARDILQNDWAKLTDREQVNAGLALLFDHDWLADRTVQTGGRPRTEYHINPKAKP